MIKYRVLSLDIVRTLAISFLLIAHIGQTLNNSLGGYFGLINFYYVSLGGLAVTIFLILSGVCLEINPKNTNTTFIHFVIQRVLRIYPIYYLSLIVGLLVVLIKLQIGMSFQLWSTSKLFSISNILGNLTGLSIYFGWGGGGFVSTAWFVGLIMALYVVYKPISASIKIYPHHTIVVLLILSAVSRIIVGQYFNILALNWLPFCRLFEFGLGVYLVRVTRIATLNVKEKYNIASKLFRFTSDLSFPLFLVHYPLLFIIPLLLGHGINVISIVVIYCIVAVLVAAGMLIIDHSILPSAWQRTGLSSRL